MKDLLNKAETDTKATTEYTMDVSQDLNSKNPLSLGNSEKIANATETELTNLLKNN